MTAPSPMSISIIGESSQMPIFPDRRRNPFPDFPAFPDEAGRFHVSRFPFIDELLSIDVEDIGSCPSELLCDQEPSACSGKTTPCRMVLDGMEEADFHPGTVTQDETIPRGTIMVGRHEPLDVKPSGPAGGQTTAFALTMKYSSVSRL